MLPTQSLQLKFKGAKSHTRIRLTEKGEMSSIKDKTRSPGGYLNLKTESDDDLDHNEQGEITITEQDIPAL